MEQSNPTYRPLHLAIANAHRIRDELPFLIQPSQTSFDMVTLAAEVLHLRELLADRPPAQKHL